MNGETGVFLWGGGSQCRLVTHMLDTDGLKVRYVFDPYLTAPSFAAAARFSNQKADLPTMLGNVTAFYVCIGAEHGLARFDLLRKIKVDYGLPALSVRSRAAFIDETCHIGEALLAMPGAIVNGFTEIGEGVVLNTGAVVDHECVLGNGVHVMGGATIAGRVKILDYCTIGANATVLPNLTIGQGAFVGAGAVVTKDVPPYAVVVGAPGRVIRQQTLRSGLSFFDGP